ncbi:MAG TPA: FecR domain-containing protein [Caulobacteraceae bacterium]
MTGAANPNIDAIRDQAIAWRMRREAGVLSPADTDAFSAWLAEAPEHQDAYAAADELWAASGQLERHPLFDRTREWAERASRRSQVTRRSIAASFAAAVVGLGGLSVYLQTAPKPLVDQSFRTAVGQQATVTLPDGSQLTLNTDTVVRTKADEGRRVVYLDKGQAFFKVAKDARHPFVVTAAGRTVTALGTAFDVRIDDGELKVVLVEGRVRVQSSAPAIPPTGKTGRTPAPPPMTTDMSAGSQLVAADDTEWRLTPTNVARETSWLKGQLVFDDEALADIVDEMNRYSTRKMVIDERLAHRRLSGNFTPGDVHGFSQALRASGLADLRDGADGSIRIVPLSEKVQASI